MQENKFTPPALVILGTWSYEGVLYPPLQFSSQCGMKVYGLLQENLHALPSQGLNYDRNSTLLNCPWFLLHP